MSTPVTGLAQRHNLRAIFHYGKECLLNRWKLLLNIAFFLIFLPRLLSNLVVSQGATTFVGHVRSGALASGNLLDQLENLVDGDLKRAAIFSTVSFIFILIGLLALARASVDYFEQKPSSVGSSTQAAIRALFFKGFGAFIMLVIVLIPTSILALLRVVVLCLMVMLPLELVAGHSGGLRSVTNVLFLRYSQAAGKQRKWPVFSNIMTVGGLVLSLAFLLELVVLYLMDIDVFLGWKAAWWTSELSLLGGSISRGHFIMQSLELLLNSALVAAAMPFIASLRFFSQESSFRREA